MAGLKPLLKDIANAIRNRSGTTAAIPASEFEDRIGKLLNVASDGAYVSGPLYLESGDKFGTTLSLYKQSGGVATFDGKTLRIPMTVRVSSRGSNTSNFDIVISFE